jgi:NAD-dependent deacetylase
MSLGRKKIVIFSGAGLDRESGVLTFRDCKDGLWNNHKIEDVATPSGWAKDRAAVLNFYNELRRQMPDVHPNEGHKLIASLEKDYDVVNLTQNVSDLLERGGATNVIHLHGELTKARGSLYAHKASPADQIIDIGYNDINIGDKCPVTESQLRPHIVWFGEMPFGVDRGYQAIRDADYLVVIGTSLNIGYTLDMLAEAKDDCKVFYIDPEPAPILGKYTMKTVTYMKYGGAEGMAKFIEKLNTPEECAK